MGLVKGGFEKPGAVVWTGDEEEGEVRVVSQSPHTGEIVWCLPV